MLILDRILPRCQWLAWEWQRLTQSTCNGLEFPSSDFEVVWSLHLFPSFLSSWIDLCSYTMDARKDVAKGASASLVILFTRAHLSCIGSLSLASSLVPLLKCALFFFMGCIFCFCFFSFSFIPLAAGVKRQLIHPLVLVCWPFIGSPVILPVLPSSPLSFLVLFSFSPFHPPILSSCLPLSLSPSLP